MECETRRTATNDEPCGCTPGRSECGAGPRSWNVLRQTSTTRRLHPASSADGGSGRVHLRWITMITTESENDGPHNCKLGDFMEPEGCQLSTYHISSNAARLRRTESSCSTMADTERWSSNHALLVITWFANHLCISHLSPLYAKPTTPCCVCNAAMQNGRFRRSQTHVGRFAPHALSLFSSHFTHTGSAESPRKKYRPSSKSPLHSCHSSLAPRIRSINDQNISPNT